MAYSMAPPSSLAPAPHVDSERGRGSYKGTSLIRNNPTLGPYSRPVPKAVLWS